MVKHRFEILDLIRGLAALLVMMGHLRGIFFVPFNELPEATPIMRVFYFFTGYGHQCVIIFFVLSGFFVGAAYHQSFNPRSIGSGLKKYGINRMARLWTVLVPALALTWGLDLLGLYLSHSEAYTTSDFFPYIPLTNDRTAVTFAGNLFFLQTLLVPTFGTNGPLWSLANEFWYYLVFPALYILFVKGIAATNRVMALVIVAGVIIFLYFLNVSFLEGLLIWLMGFGASLVIRRIPNLLKLFGLGFFGLIFVVVRIGQFPYQDIMLGLATVALIISVKDMGAIWLERTAGFLSRISYTLYLVHLPMIVFIKSIFFEDVRMGGGILSLIKFGLLATLVTAISYCVYWLFERNTDIVKERMKRLIVTDPR